MLAMSALVYTSPFAITGMFTACFQAPSKQAQREYKSRGSTQEWSITKKVLRRETQHHDREGRGGVQREHRRGKKKSQQGKAGMNSSAYDLAQLREMVDTLGPL